MKKEVTSKIKRIDTEVDKLRIKRKDTDTLKVKENVFDEPTLKTLYTLSNKKIIEAIGGSISTGKEANIFLAEDEEKDIAVKIYRISSSNFNSMEEYILGDPRFRNVRHSKRDIIFAWTKKEQRNLVRAKDAGIHVPEPIVAERNILVMEFMGENGTPYPQLKGYRLGKENAEKVFNIIINYVDLLYNKANLVHGDLSEYNILMIPEKDEPVFIDMGQSVTREHPRSIDFLRRDIENIVRYFKKYKIIADPQEIYTSIRNKEKKNEENDL
ncbi:serine protein kinase RIO [Methanolobus bombayensis]|uniref:serine protein kinase RIO n=1 Tax=Methanolobus bombayensis TaxID=38023 RepID=UPI001AE24FC7|nr:serine protein kinase RIO [Methanolobus bombayensis]MBP1910039.1 RIO kinase 1 [Methanolobus bombayensis]